MRRPADASRPTRATAPAPARDPARRASGRAAAGARRFAVLAAAALLAPIACDAPRPTAGGSSAGAPGASPGAAPDAPRSASRAAGAASTGASVAGPTDSRPAAIWGDTVIEWSDLRPRLAERSGGAVLEEMLIDRRLEALLRERGRPLTPAQIAAEEQILLETLDPDPSRAASLLRSLRQVQGLSTLRWNDLLRRNASLRALVADEVKVSDDAVEAALDAAHGAKRRCRIIALPDARAAEDVAGQLSRGANFAELAVERSTDRSAERGGLLAPVSRLDPSFPASFRNALWSLQPGAVSAPVLLDQSWVLILCEREIPAGSALGAASEREKARTAVRRAQERLLMENLARSIVRDTTTVTVFDDALQESWRSARSAPAADPR